MISDDRLRLIFTCSFIPALASEAQVALTLRTLGGRETDEIARRTVPPATMAQRLVRAKRKIRDAGIPYYGSGNPGYARAVDAVLTVIYLIFNEGYTATRGETLVRTHLCAEAIRLARLVRRSWSRALRGGNRFWPSCSFTIPGAGRLDEAGDLILLEDQDRGLWNGDQIAEALPLVGEALRGGPGPVAIQAAISAIHCQAGRADQTDWPQILQLYDLLDRVQPSPIVSLNRAVAVAKVEGPERRWRSSARSPRPVSWKPIT